MDLSSSVLNLMILLSSSNDWYFKRRSLFDMNFASVSVLDLNVIYSSMNDFRSLIKLSRLTSFRFVSVKSATLRLGLKVIPVY